MINEGEGFIGFNPEDSIHDIEAIGSHLQAIADAFKSAGETFFTGLRNNWASPKAQMFGSTWSGRLYTNTVNTTLIEASNIVEILTQAYNVMVSQQGYPTIDPPIFFTINNEANFGSLNGKDPNGNIGMNVSNVRKILQEYKAAIDNITADLSETPTKIHIQDPNGTVTAQVEKCIVNIETSISDSVIDIYAKVLNEAETEADTMITVVNKTADTVALAGSRTPSTIATRNLGSQGGVVSTSNKNASEVKGGEEPQVIPKPDDME